MLDNNAQDRHSIISKWQMQSHCESAIAGVKDWIPCRIWHNAGCKACTTFSEIAADAQLHCTFLVGRGFFGNAEQHVRVCLLLGVACLLIGRCIIVAAQQQKR